MLQDAIQEVEQEDVDAAAFVLTGPSNARNITDEEEEDNEYSTTVVYLGKFQER